ncbi:MAG: chorismate synthase [Pirellulaceae bacterium]|nr:chorismate synthase [Pirellulaceae bacterium]
MLRYWTSGESHGKTMLAMVDGFPAGVKVNDDQINFDLKLRQGGYGRGKRQQLETDQVEFLSGTWQGTTLGSPIAMQVINRDYKLERLKELERPRPGHGDLTGAVKYLGSIRGVLERASARESCVRVAAGSLAKQMLSHFGIRVIGYVVQLGGVDLPLESANDFDSMLDQRTQSAIYSLCPSKDPEVISLIDQTAEDGDTLGGIVETKVTGLPFGLGTHAQWDKKLDGKLAQAVMAVQAIKGVEIGLGFQSAALPGSKVHDPIQYDATATQEPNLGFIRPSNNAGGLEAGMTNGQPLVVRAAKKPIATLRKPLESINLATKEKHTANYERSDVCAVSACSIIIENVIAFEIAAAFVEKFGGDSVLEMKKRFELFNEMARKR